METVIASLLNRQNLEKYDLKDGKLNELSD